MSHQHGIYSHRDNIARKMSTKGEAIWSYIIEEDVFLESSSGETKKKELNLVDKR